MSLIDTTGAVSRLSADQCTSLMQKRAHAAIFLVVGAALVLPKLDCMVSAPCRGVYLVVAVAVEHVADFTGCRGCGQSVLADIAMQGFAVGVAVASAGRHE